MTHTPESTNLKLTEMAHQDFFKLREAAVGYFGNDQKIKEWQRGKFIKLSYGIATGYRAQEFKEAI